MKRIFWTVVALVVAASAAMVFAGDATYIGAEKCKMCHKVEYASWSEMKHKGAFDLLSADEQGKAECTKCHATGGSVDMPGVQCEACHGPGSEYKSMKVMKDHDASLAAGLVLPDEALCKSCHEGAPHDVSPFDFASAGAHKVKESK
jgi:RecJ-like exonuclease